MNILVIPSWYENNKNKTHGSFFKEQAKSLSELGHNVYILYVDIIRFNEIDRIISTKKYDFYTDEKLKVYRKKIVKIPKLPEQYVANYVKDGIIDLYEKFIKDKIRIDVIHAHSFIWGGYAGVELSKKYNIPIMVTEHYSGFYRELFSKEEKILIKNSMDLCDKCVSVSSGLKKSMMKYTESEISVIYNMVDSNKFKLKEEIFEVQNKNNKFRFVTVCYLKQIKGIDLLLNAFSLAFEKYNDVELYIGGDGEERKNLERLVKKLDLGNKVSFLGLLNREEVVKNMMEADCFVLPSRHETFGVVYIEALALGKPVIATDTDAIHDILNERNGIIVEKENVNQLKNALKSIKENYKKYNEKKISEECISKFDKKIISKQIESELKKISINKKEVNNMELLK